MTTAGVERPAMGAAPGPRICLITTGQPSSNPRLVKEADALVDAGYDVHVVAAYFADWATESDARLVAARRWRLTFVDWRRSVSPALFHQSRLRHLAARALAPRMPGQIFAAAALSRVGPELFKAAMNVPAELYVAHNLGALPVAVKVAAARSAMVAFDAEDCHTGQVVEAREPRTVAFIRAVERRGLASCAFVTAASPLIAESYRRDYGLPLPTTILNVFPLRDRPEAEPAPDAAAPLRLYWFSQTIGPDRGLEDVVDAMSRLRDAPIELHVRGLWRGGYEEALRRRATDRGLDPGRIVHHPPGTPDEMVRLAAAYDVGLAVEPGITPNNAMALSNKVFTYLLAGNAVLATRTPGQGQLSPAIDRATAWCEPGSAASIAGALQRWSGDREALGAARRAAWRLGGDRFNWDVERHRYLDLVAAAFDSREKPARRPTMSLTATG